MATYFVDFVGGNDANDGLSFANRKKTYAGLQPVAGDVVRVMETRAPYSLGNADFTNNSATVALASPKTQLIDDCDVAWTASASVTSTLLSTSAYTGTWRTGTNCNRFSIAAAFTTGKIAYRTLPAPLDLSSYTCVSLSFGYQSDVAAGVFRLDLCSDTTGDVPVASMLLTSGGNSSRGISMFLDNGGPLPSNVQSVALYAVSDPGTIAIEIDNLVACQARDHADHLCHDSIIGKNTEAEPMWYPIRGFAANGDVLVGDQVATPSSPRRVYPYATETAECFAVAPALATVPLTLASATSTGTITISGGWDSTDMSTRPGTTWLSRRREGGSLVGISSIFVVRRYRIEGINPIGFNTINTGSTTVERGFDVAADHVVDTWDVFAGVNGRLVADIGVASFCSSFIYVNTNKSLQDEIKIKLGWWFGSAMPNYGFWGNAGSIAAPFVTDLLDVEIGHVANNLVGYGGYGRNAYHPIRGAVFELNTADVPGSSTYLQSNIVLDNCDFTFTISNAVTADGGSLSYVNRGGEPKRVGIITGWDLFYTTTNVVPATGDDRSWLMATNKAVWLEAPSKRAVSRFLAKAGKTYTIEFEGRRNHADVAGTVLLRHDGVEYREEYTPTVNTWQTKSFSFTAAFDDVITVYMGIYSTGSFSALIQSKNAFLANLKITET